MTVNEQLHNKIHFHVTYVFLLFPVLKIFWNVSETVFNIKNN